MMVPAPAVAQTMIAKKASRPGMESAAKKKVSELTQPVKDAKRFHVASTRSVATAAPSLQKAMKQANAYKATAASRKAAPLKATGAFPNLMGMVTYSDDWDDATPTGVYAISSTGSIEQQFTVGTGAYTGIAKDGVYYTTAYVDFYGMWQWIEMHAYDIETGEEIASTQNGEIFNLVMDFAVDPSTGDLYGIGYNEDGSSMMLAKHDFMIEGSELMDEVTPIGNLAGNWNSLACTADGQLYGISYTGHSSGDSFIVDDSKLCKLDKATAAVTEIGATGFAPQYLSSATIDTKSGTMYWAVSTDEGFLCTVDLTSGAASKLFNLEGEAEVQGLYVEAPAAEDGAPAAATDLAADFAGGALTGTVSFKAPTTLFDGTAASGSLNYEIAANGENVAAGTTTYGAEVSEEITLAASGEYTFTVTMSNAAGASPVAKLAYYAGFGVPAATTATLTYEDGTLKLTWTPVTASTDGGYFDASDVTYTVTRFPGEVKVYEGTATEFSEPVAEPTGITKYYYTVVATSNGLSSAAAQSNTVTLGAGIVPPYENTFDSASDLDGFTILDSNGDDKMWTFYDGAVRMAYNTNQAMDDWMITPPVKLEGGKFYKVSFDAAAYSAYYAERVEAKWGTAATAEAMTNELVAPTDLTSTAYETLDGMICPPADGTYYIGIHGISDADKYWLYVDNLTISAAMSAAIPAAATDLTVTPDANGELKATISFKAPAVDMAGNALASLTKIELSRNGELINTFNAPAIGAALSYTDEPEEGGDVTYTVVAYNEDGNGPEVSATAFIGIDKPAAPTNVAMTEEGNTGKVTITWDAVDTDQNGNSINPDKVWYIVAEYKNSGWYAIEGLDHITGTSVSFQAVPEGEQAFVQYAIFSETDGGAGKGMGTGLLPVGTPYDGMEESFANGRFTYAAWAEGYSYYGAWDIYTEAQLNIPSADGDNGFAGMKGQYADAYSSLFTGKVTLPAQNAGVSFYNYVIAADDDNYVQIYVKEPADADWTAVGEPFVVNTLGEGDTWANAFLPLPEYAGKTVQVRFAATNPTYTYTFIDQIIIGALVPNDLAATDIKAPATVLCGNDYEVNVTVTNKGTEDATEFTVSLYADGEKVATKTVDGLASAASTIVSFEASMGAIATEAVEYYAEVTYTADENLDNNKTATIEVAPKLSNLPKVDDLDAQSGAEGVELTWSEPDLTNVSVEPTNEGFEDGNSWAFEYEGWTFVDVDGSPVGGVFSDWDLPGVTAGVTTASFIVFDDSEIGNSAFKAHSGNLYIADIYREDYGAVDDWAISPELTGDAQTITFWAKSVSSEYPDDMEMYYSTGSLVPADFIKVGATVSRVAAVWTEYSFEVPAGAKHFAVRSCSADGLMLMLDDFTFTAAGNSAELSILGYDIYRDGQKINDEPVEECEYTDTEAADGEHSYVVVTVYTTGMSAPSNTATVEYDGIKEVSAAAISITAGKGIITVAGAEGKLLTVAAADGKLYFNGAAAARQTVAAPAGIYVVKAGTKIAKVAVK